MWFLDHPETVVALIGWLGSAFALWLHFTRRRDALEAMVNKLKEDVERHLRDCDVMATLQRLERKIDEVHSGVYGVGGR